MRLRYGISFSRLTSAPEPILWHSYAREKVFNVLNGFDKKRLLLIADECHNMGSGALVKRLKDIPYLRRIGLSATPERQFDDEGNEKLRKFFGSEENYTYEYSMEEAINKGVLCKYMYYPHLVQLTQEEMDAYVELSDRIAKYFNFAKGCFDDIDEKLKMMRSSQGIWPAGYRWLAG